MKKWSTLIYFVNKYAEHPSDSMGIGVRNLLTGSDEESGFSPSAGTIKSIMDFARSYEVLESESAGQIELVIN